MAAALLWKVYYGDGSTFSNRDGPPEEAPPSNVQLIAEADPTHHVRYRVESDYYLWQNGRWWGLDLVSLIDRLMAEGRLKLGRMLTDDEYDEVVRWAYCDPDWPRKTALRQGELDTGRLATSMAEMEGDCGCGEEREFTG